jgi:hypothetical protein
MRFSEATRIASIIAIAMAPFHDRWLKRRLPPMLRTAGFEAPRSRSYGYTSLPEPSYMFTLVDRGADLLLNAGRIGPGMAGARSKPAG